MHSSQGSAGGGMIDRLEDRLLFAYTSGISAGVLTGNGDATSESIVVSHVNVGAPSTPASASTASRRTTWPASPAS